MAVPYLADDDVETHSMGRLDVAAIPPAEEHLLVLEKRRERLVK